MVAVLLCTCLQNYENMFYSYYFDTGPLSKKRFEARFKTGAGKNPTTSEEERWLGMSFNSMFDGKGMKTHGRPNLNVVIGTQPVKIFLHHYFVLLQCWMCQDQWG